MKENVAVAVAVAVALHSDLSNSQDMHEVIFPQWVQKGNEGSECKIYTEYSSIPITPCTISISINNLSGEEKRFPLGLVTSFHFSSSDIRYKCTILAFVAGNETVDFINFVTNGYERIHAGNDYSPEVYSLETGYQAPSPYVLYYIRSTDYQVLECDSLDSFCINSESSANQFLYQEAASDLTYEIGGVSLYRTQFCSVSKNDRFRADYQGIRLPDNKCGSLSSCTFSSCSIETRNGGSNSFVLKSNDEEGGYSQCLIITTADAESNSTTVKDKSTPLSEEMPINVTMFYESETTSQPDNFFLEDGTAHQARFTNPSNGLTFLGKIFVGVGVGVGVGVMIIVTTTAMIYRYHRSKQARTYYFNTK